MPSAAGGPEEAAILLISLGDEAAAAVMSHFTPKELKDVTQALANIERVTEDQLGKVVESFRQGLKGQTPLGARAPEFTRRVLTTTLGEDQASAVLSQLTRSDKPQAIEPLLWAEPRELAETIEGEHPQVIATVLGMLEPELAANVMDELPEAVSKEAVIRLAQLGEISPMATAEIEALFAQRGSTSKRIAAPTEVDGPRRLANIVNCLEADMEQSIMDALRDTDEKLAGSVEDLMFVFENLRDLDDRGFQTMMREISNEFLVPALKGAPGDLRDRFFDNMSKRAAEMLRDDLEVSGPIRLSEVEAAQKEVLTVARRLADAGQIMLGGKGGDEYV